LFYEYTFFDPKSVPCCFCTLGVQQITLADLGQWQPDASKTERRTRPDRSAALTRAAEYEAWFQQRAAQGLANLNTG
jgi:hypothetical protein